MSRFNVGTVAIVAAAVAAATRPAAVAVVGAVAVLVVAVRVVGSDFAANARWRRGWWLVAAAIVPTAVSASPGIAPTGARPLLALAGALAVLFGAAATLPTRDTARMRGLVGEAAIGGMLVAYIIGAILPVAASRRAGLDLLALAATVAALWLVVLHVLRDRDVATRADRLLAVAIGALIVARVPEFLALVDAVTLPLEIGSAAAAAALVCWGAALLRPEVAEDVPLGSSPEEVIHGGQVLLVVAGVLTGPTVVTLHGLLRGTQDLVPLAVVGAIVALVAVLHLVQLVHDHGRRAWRARHDALTGLPAEPLFEDRLGQAMVRARRTGAGVAIAFVDLDGFKRVNDRDGHEAGDAVLRAVAVRLRGALREEDTVARKSGDEFLVLLPGVNDPMDAERVAGKLLAVMLPPIEIDGHRYQIGASVGLALWPRDGHTPDELIRHADAAMYEVKEAAGGSVRWYTTATTTRTRLRFTLAQQLEAATAATDQLELAYQPRVDLRDDRVVELVALVRWRHPELGLLTPRSFLPLAAEVGLTRALDLYILNRACSDLADWAAAGLIDVPVMVHVADGHLTHMGFEDAVVQALTSNGLAPRRLRLAIGETGLAQAADRARRTLGGLAEVGVRATVARFGTGAAGVGTLAEVPLAAVELAAVHVAAGRPRSRAVVAAALAVAQRLGLEATANGVSDDAAVARLQDAGCVTGRGPHLATPLLTPTLTGRLAALAALGDHDPATVPAALLRRASESADAERPEVAAALAAAIQVDAGVDEHDLTQVLSQLTDRGVRAPSR